MSQSNNKLGTMSIGKLLIRMALPITFSMLIQALYNTVDSIFVSSVSQEALTAVSLVFPIQSLMVSVAIGTAIGMNSLVSRRLGEKNNKAANIIANNGVLLAICSSAAFAIFGLLFSDVFLSSSSTASEVVSGGAAYMKITTAFSLGLFMQLTFERLVQATGKTIYQMIAQLAGALLNIALDPIFIFGYFGVPAMGVVGAAVATVIAQWFAMIIIIVLNHKHNREIQITPKALRFKFSAVIDIYRVGLPSIIVQSIGSFIIIGLNQILSIFTETAVNVLGIYYKIRSFVFMPLFSLTCSFIPIVAFNYGAQDKKRVLQAIRLAIISSAVIMFTGALIFWFAPGLLLSMFSPTPELLEIGIPAIRVIAISFPFAGLCIIFSSLFQALGKGMYSLYMNAGVQLLVLLPAAFILAQTLGLFAVWFSFLLAEVVTIILALTLFRKVYRKQIAPLPDSVNQSR